MAGVNDLAGLKARLEEATAAALPRQTAWLADLVRFASTRGQEGDCQRWLAGQFAGRGWQVDLFSLADVALAGAAGASPAVEVDLAEALQVVAKVPARVTEGRSLILQGHIDVVPPGPRELWRHDPFDPQIADGRIHGRGTADMKVGVAAMVFALEALAAIGLEPTADIFVETVSEEECTGNGALGTLLRGHVAEACLIPEAVGNRLLRAQLGSVWFRLRLLGEPAHILERGPGASAILQMYDHACALQDLAAAANRLAAEDPWFGAMAQPVTFSMGKICGGDWIGMVPAWCEADCRIGVLPGQSVAAVREAICAQVAQCAARIGSAVPEVSWIGFAADPYVLAPGGAAEAALASAHELVFGAPLESFCLPATTDVRQYGVHYGIPALCYGSSGGGIHAANEYADLESMRQTTITLALFVALWCGVRPALSA
ncbi:MAG TPA: ArgE/DapE family deacylase [Novosphingobium sp.]|nr:ArgE/DapE family deacylase [Novosphingobium sp.]